MDVVNEYLELNESLKRTFLVYRKGSSESIWLNEYENEIYQKLKQYDRPLTLKEIKDLCNFNVIDYGLVNLLDVMAHKKIIDVDIKSNDYGGLVDFVKVYSAD